MADELTPIRQEDIFDVAAVHSWLSQKIEVNDSLPEVMQFRSGASNLTYLLTYPDRELVLRRPPVGKKAASAHDMKREVLIQSRLKSNYPLVPEIFALCDDQSIIGSNFYLMEKINGEILRRDIPKNLPTEKIAVIGSSLIEGLAHLHTVDAGVLAELNKGPGYVRRQVAGWSVRYRNALTDDVPTAELLMKWLDENQPGDQKLCVIHGDWRIDNSVINPESGALVGVLDWELATVGDPLMDLGSAMAYWVDQSDDPDFLDLRRQPSHAVGMPTRKEFVERYLAVSKSDCQDFTYYEVFGLFRLAVIIQQIWYRYRAGQTTNPAFAGFGVGCNTLINRAERMIG
jgi:aminoglycoside phosphotransferase (APT) family kinase protein